MKFIINRKDMKAAEEKGLCALERILKARPEMDDEQKQERLYREIEETERDLKETLEKAKCIQARLYRLQFLLVKIPNKP